MFLFQPSSTKRCFSHSNQIGHGHSKNLIFENPKNPETPAANPEAANETPEQRLLTAKTRLESARQSLEGKMGSIKETLRQNGNSSDERRQAEYQNVDSFLSSSKNLLKDAVILLQNNNQDEEKIDQTTSAMDKLISQRNEIESLLDQFAYREARRTWLGAMSDAGLKAKGAIQNMLESTRSHYVGIMPTESMLPENIENRNKLFSDIVAVQGQPQENGEIDTGQAFASLDKIKGKGGDRLRIAAEVVKKRIDLTVQQKMAEAANETPEVSANPVEEANQLLEWTTKIVAGEDPFVKITLQDIIDGYQAEVDETVMRQFNNNPKAEVACGEYVKREAQHLKDQLRQNNSADFQGKKEDIDRLANQYSQKLAETKDSSVRMQLMKEFKAYLDSLNEENITSARIYAREAAKVARKKKPGKKEAIDNLESEFIGKLEATKGTAGTEKHNYFAIIDEFKQKLQEV